MLFGGEGRGLLLVVLDCLLSRQEETICLQRWADMVCVGDILTALFL